MMFRFLDYLILIFSITLVSFSFIFSAQQHKGVISVSIETADKKYIYPISQNNTLTLNGTIGETVISIYNNKVYVEDSDCKDKTCMAMGKISKTGEWIACLPNRIFIRIVSNTSEEAGIDDGVF